MKEDFDPPPCGKYIQRKRKGKEIENQTDSQKQRVNEIKRKRCRRANEKGGWFSTLRNKSRGKEREKKIRGKERESQTDRQKRRVSEIKRKRQRRTNKKGLRFPSLWKIYPEEIERGKKIKGNERESQTDRQTHRTTEGK